MAFQSNSEIELSSRKVAVKKIRKRAFFKKDSLKGIADKAEYLFSFISLFFFTDAITMVVLTGGVSEGDVFSYDTMNFAPVQLFYIINYGITIFLLACRYKQTIYILLSNPLLIATSTFIASSFLWSFAPAESLKGGMFAVCNMLFAVYLAGRYTLKQQLTMLSYVLLTITILNFVFVYAFPQYGIMGGSVHPGAWRGVFTHKNGAGRIMVLACGVIFTMFNEVKNKHLKLMYLIGFILAVIMIDKARSGGALVNSFFILNIVMIIQVFKSESRKLFLALVFLATLSVFIAFAYVPLMTFALGLLGKDPTLTGRTDIWEYIYTMIAERPAFGYGVGGFWQGEKGASLYVIQRAGWLVPDAHQGFLDTTLQIGIIGASMVSLVLWQALLRGLSRVRLFKTWVSSWPAVYILYISLVNMSESSLLAPNSIFWVLVCSISMTMSFEAKYLIDFGRFGLMNGNENITSENITKANLSEHAHTNI
jgi:exopolysaccharide production protein ExoQ